MVCLIIVVTVVVATDVADFHLEAEIRGLDQSFLFAIAQNSGPVRRI